MAKPTGMGQLPPKGPQAPEEDDDDVLAMQQAMGDDQPETGDEPDYTENEDGSVDVSLEDLAGPDQVDSESFDENLADLLKDSVTDAIGLEYIELIEADIKAREKRDKQYADGIKRTGMGNEAPGGADFDGASRVVHPMLTKASVDFASRAIKELFPANGPCKTQIIGEQTEDKLDKAERKKKFMNWQSTTQIEENRSELEKLLSQVPLGGAQYKRWWFDPELKRNRTEAVFIDNVFTPYGHSDFYTSPRVTHRQKILRNEYERRIRTGLYRQLDLPEDSFLGLQDESEAQVSTDKVEGVDPQAMAYNEDGLRVVYEVQCMMSLEEDPLLPEEASAPYILHIDATSKKVLGLYRNWKEDDERLRKKHWMTEWPFIPWRDGPAVGMAHIIGTMSGAATGALRAILDASHIQNFPGGLKLKGGKTSGQSIQVNATELAEIDPPAGMADPDIRKLVMPFPFNGPSQVLFNTLEWLTQQAEQVVATASEKIAEAGNDMPVGTAMALIEHGSANFSAIHARLHAAMKHDLEILHRLNSENLDDEETIEDLGELVIRREDFMGPMDIIPVSDPNIFSETQRYAQLQAVMQLKADPSFAQFFKPDQLLARALKLLQVPDIDGIANLPKDAKKLDALEENYVASSADESRPLKVYQDQDDLAHLKMHIIYCTSPIMGANPLIANGLMPKMLQHCKEHLLSFYKKHTQAATESMRAVAQMQNMTISEEDMQLQGAAFADQLMAQLLGPMVMPGLQKMQEIIQQISQSSAPKPSPEIVLQENTKKELKGMELKAHADEAEKDRNQQSQAAQIAAAAEAADQKNQQALAQLTTNVQLIITQMNNGSKQLMAEFQANKAMQQTVVTEVLTAALAGVQQQMKAQTDAITKLGAVPGSSPPSSGGSGPADELLKPLMPMVENAMAQGLTPMDQSQLLNTVQALTLQYQNLQQILEQERQTNGAAIQQLSQGLQGLSAMVTPKPQMPPQGGPGGPPPGGPQPPQGGPPGPGGAPSGPPQGGPPSGPPQGGPPQPPQG